jgi:hypothetical protein
MPSQKQHPNSKDIVDKVGRFYKAQDPAAGTHLALRWKGRVRFTVPREVVGQRACWKVFHPGRLEVPLRAMACLPRVFGSASCVEAEQLASIREAIGKEAGFSCCRAGAPGPWLKDTILLLDKKTAKPLYIVKAGTGEAVDSLLRNEAHWLRTLYAEASLADHIPQLVAHHSGADFCFVAERPLPGKPVLELGESQIAFLRKFQEHTRQTMFLEESRLYRNLCSRLKELSGLLSEAWATRLDKGMQRIKQSLSGKPILLVAAHNDFTPWNIRVERGVARVFDWEYADAEQLPLFDPLHFVLMPMALKRRPVARMVENMDKTMRMCQRWLGMESCYEAQTQALAYLMNLCTLYLWSERGKSDSDTVLESHAAVIDYLCRL